LLGARVGAVAAVYGLPLVIANLGFGGGGIAAGGIPILPAWAGGIGIGVLQAQMMRLNGGAVAAGGVVAVVLSIGALGGIAGNKAAARFFRNANEEERKGFVLGLAACMMSPYGGSLSPERVTSVLRALQSGGLDAIRNAEDKANVVLCLAKIASSHKV